MQFSSLLAVFTPLLGISLVSTSAYSLWNISHLQLPLSKTVALITTLLPILSLSSIQYLRIANRESTKSPTQWRPTRPQITDKMFLGIFGLLLLDTTLITLTSTSLPSKPLLCPLNEQWERLWSSPSERASSQPALKTIQDSLSCCGLHSSHDKFYPFPIPNPEVNANSNVCTKFYPDRAGRNCYQPWLEQTQLSAGLVLMAIAGSMIMKIVGLLLVRYNHPLGGRILYESWFGGQDPIIPGDTRIKDVDDEEAEETFVYDGDARVRGDGHGTERQWYLDAPARVRGDGNGTERERYLDAPAKKNDRLLGNGHEVNRGTGRIVTSGPSERYLDAPARVRGDGHGTERERYLLDAPAKKNDRLLGNGHEVNSGTGRVVTSGPSVYYDDDDDDRSFRAI